MYLLREETDRQKLAGQMAGPWNMVVKLGFHETDTCPSWGKSKAQSTMSPDRSPSPLRAYKAG